MRDMDVKILEELEKILPDEEPEENNNRKIEEPIKRRSKK